MSEMNYRLWVNETRTVLVRLWDNGDVEVAARETAAHTWGPPTHCTEETVTQPAGSAAGKQAQAEAE